MGSYTTALILCTPTLYVSTHTIAPMLHMSPHDIVNPVLLDVKVDC